MSLVFYPRFKWVICRLDCPILKLIKRSESTPTYENSKEEYELYLHLVVFLRRKIERKKWMFVHLIVFLFSLFCALISWHIPLLFYFASMLHACCFPISLFLSPILSHMCFQASRGSQTAFHKDNVALLSRWSLHVLPVINVSLDTPRDRGDFTEHLDFSTDAYPPSV